MWAYMLLHAGHYNCLTLAYIHIYALLYVPVFQRLHVFSSMSRLILIFFVCFIVCLIILIRPDYFGIVTFAHFRSYCFDHFFKAPSL